MLKSKLNTGNIIKAINAWSVSLLRYVTGIVVRNQKELQMMDRKTRKPLMIQKASFYFKAWICVFQVRELVMLTPTSFSVDTRSSSTLSTL